MAIGIEQKKSFLQPILMIVLAAAAIFALFFFGSKSDFFKKMTQATPEASLEVVKRINIDFDFLNGTVIDELKPFPSFPSFFGTSTGTTSPVVGGRENPFIPYQSGAAKQEAASDKKTTVPATEK